MRPTRRTSDPMPIHERQPAATTCRHHARERGAAAAAGRLSSRTGRWRPPLSRLAAVALAVAASACSLAAAAASLPLIPRAAQVDMAAGSVRIDAGTRIFVAAGDAPARRVAGQLAELLARTRGLRLAVSSGTPPSGRPAITLHLAAAAPVAQAEGYALDIDAAGARIAARDEAGLFYGAVSLWQLLTADGGQGPAVLPAARVRDWPRFAWRGLMIDSARHMQSVAEIERLLGQMAQHKLNVLHWHLSDDQGWRLQIKRHPELTRIGAWRVPPNAGEDGEPARYGGFYTQDQVREVVAYAAARHITVVPELDMPGHAQAAVAAYPRLGVTGQRPPVSVDWGVNPYLYNVDEATFRFLEEVLDEVMALFPSRYIHVGGDEAIKDQWQASPAVQAKRRALGLKDEDALQGWFIGRIGRYLAAHGRRLVGWDEILAGGVPADAAVMSWRGVDGAVAAARQGHDVVLSPSPQLYFDHVQSARLDEPAGRPPVIDLASVYAFEVVPKGLDTAQARHVLGAQANLWTEHMPGAAHLEHAAFPRLDALAEAVWTPAARRDWPDFLARLPAQLARYRRQGIGYADSAFAVDVGVDRNAALASGTARVALASQSGAGTIRYSLDGSVPGPASPIYRNPLAVKLPAKVIAVALDARGVPLAAPRQRVLDAAHLLSLGGAELRNCPGSDFALRAQPEPDAATLAPVYNVDVFDSCWVYPQARLDGIAAVHVEAARLPRNYALAHEAAKVVSRTPATAHGELVVRQDRCDGPVLASLPLPAPAAGNRRFALDGTLPAQRGVHDLCLIFTAPSTGPLYAIGRIALVPASP
jgi:hexosaminidase